MTWFALISLQTIYLQAEALTLFPGNYLVVLLLVWSMQLLQKGQRGGMVPIRKGFLLQVMN